MNMFTMPWPMVSDGMGLHLGGRYGCSGPVIERARCPLRCCLSTGVPCAVKVCAARLCSRTLCCCRGVCDVLSHPCRLRCCLPRPDFQLPITQDLPMLPRLGIHGQAACSLQQEPQHDALVFLIETGNRDQPAIFDEASRAGFPLPLPEHALLAANLRFQRLLLLQQACLSLLCRFEFWCGHRSGPLSPSHRWIVADRGVII